MALKCGIVGLPNVGKSTLFNALLSKVKAQAANYPFCTIEPNVGIVAVPDDRLMQISKYIKPQKLIPTSFEFVDIAGLVKGASKGEGLGNQFLTHIKDCDAIAHVVRCFEDDDVVHVSGGVDPISDVEIIETELVLADLASIEKRKDRLKKMVKSGDKKSIAQDIVVSKLLAVLSEGKLARSADLSNEEWEVMQDVQLITKRPMLFVANVDEDTATTGNNHNNPHLKKLEEHAAKNNATVIPICAKIEAELVEMEGEEKDSFLKDLGIETSGLNQLIRAAYDLLGLRTYFTAGEKEVRAWTIHEGWTAPQAAGVIHSDFERGFICAETYHYNDLIEKGSVAKMREAGLLRQEGKEYIVKDGDVILFRFNV